MTTTLKEIYTDEFYAQRLRFYRRGINECMRWLIKEYKIESVIDFGCGVGSYLEAAFDSGLSKIKGFDSGLNQSLKFIPQKRQWNDIIFCGYIWRLQ